MYGRTVLGVYLTALDDAIRRNMLDSAADKSVRPSTPPAVSTSDYGHESDGSATKKARRNPPRRARPVSGSRNVKSATSGKSPEKPPPSEEVAPMCLIFLRLTQLSLVVDSTGHIALALCSSPAPAIRYLPYRQPRYIQTRRSHQYSSWSHQPVHNTAADEIPDQRAFDTGSNI